MTMATRVFKGLKIECDCITPPYLSGVVGKPEVLQTNIICLGGNPHHGERLVFDGDCEEEFYEWAKKNGLVTMRKNGEVFFTDNPIAYEPDGQSK